MLEKEEIVSPNLEELKSHYHSIITLLGEDAGREGLLKTPERVAKAMLSLTKGYPWTMAFVTPSDTAVLTSASSANTICCRSTEKHMWHISLTAISRD